MNYNGCCRKFDVKKFISKYSSSKSQKCMLTSQLLMGIIIILISLMLFIKQLNQCNKQLDIFFFVILTRRPGTISKSVLQPVSCTTHIATQYIPKHLVTDTLVNLQADCLAYMLYCFCLVCVVVICLFVVFVCIQLYFALQLCVYQHCLLMQSFQFLFTCLIITITITHTFSYICI